MIGENDGARFGLDPPLKPGVVEVNSVVLGQNAALTKAICTPKFRVLFGTGGGSDRKRRKEPGDFALVGRLVPSANHACLLIARLGGLAAYGTQQFAS